MFNNSRIKQKYIIRWLLQTAIVQTILIIYAFHYILCVPELNYSDNLQANQIMPIVFLLSTKESNKHRKLVHFF